jgi:hypothetical protein
MRHGENYASCIHDCIHPCTEEEEEEEEEEEVTFARYKKYHMKTDHEDQKAIPLVQLITLQIIRKSY